MEVNAISQIFLKNIFYPILERWHYRSILTLRYLTFEKVPLSLTRWYRQSILILSPSFSIYSLSFLSMFHLRHSRDGADFHIFILSLSFSNDSLSLSTFVFQRYSVDGADSQICTLSLSFFRYLLSLPIFVLARNHKQNTIQFAKHGYAI